MMWLVEGALAIVIGLLVALIICKCKDCADKLEDK